MDDPSSFRSTDQISNSQSTSNVKVINHRNCLLPNHRIQFVDNDLQERRSCALECRHESDRMCTMPLGCTKASFYQHDIAHNPFHVKLLASSGAVGVCQIDERTDQPWWRQYYPWQSPIYTWSPDRWEQDISVEGSNPVSPLHRSGKVVLSGFGYALQNRRPGRHIRRFKMQFFERDAQESGAFLGGFKWRMLHVRTHPQ